VHETITFLLVTFSKYSPILNFFTHRLSNKPLLIWLLTTPPHLKYAATLPCNLSLMACFADINVSQSSVATYARYGRIFSMHLTANLSRNFPAKKNCKSVEIQQNYGHESVAPFFGPPCIIGRGMRQDEDVHCYQNLYDEGMVKSHNTVNIMASCDTGKMPIISFKVFQSEQSIVSSTTHRDCSTTSACRGVFIGVKARRRRSYMYLGWYRYLVTVIASVPRRRRRNLGRYRYLVTVIARVRWLQSRVHLGCIGCRH